MISKYTTDKSIVVVAYLSVKFLKSCKFKSKLEIRSCLK